MRQPRNQRQAKKQQEELIKMRSAAGDFSIGAYRPIYLWGGSGTIRMNRLKFMDQHVDEASHYQAHKPRGVKQVVEDMRCNWVHLTYNWGFPPEIEQKDWEEFKEAAGHYHDAGVPVFAYIQVSNCVFEGSYEDKTWYALDPKGDKVFYYSGRYMTCLRNPDWKNHLKEMIRGALDRGADGIFLDNLWNGCMPTSLAGIWTGAAGCHCPDCKQAYKEESGKSIPTRIDLTNPDVQQYLQWRSQQTTELVKELAEHVRSLKPGTPISANDFDIFTHNAFLIYGLNFRELAGVQDILMIENFSLPRWEEKEPARLVNNALTIRNSLPLIPPSKHLSILSYDRGIGFDDVYPVRRIKQGIYEAAVCGASMTVKGTEYYSQGEHTTLTNDRFTDLHHEIGKVHQWLEANAHFFRNCKNIAPVGLIFPGEDLWLNWDVLSDTYFAACQTLTHKGIPWKVVANESQLEGVKVLLAFTAKSLNNLNLPPGLFSVYVPGLSHWKINRKNLLAKSEGLRNLLSNLTHKLHQEYHGRKVSRRVMDWLGAPKLVLNSPVFHLPERAARAELISTLPPSIYPNIMTNAPVLIEIRQTISATHIHLVNYASTPQTVEVQFSKTEHGRLVSPDVLDQTTFEGTSIRLNLDIYRIIQLTR